MADRILVWYVEAISGDGTEQGPVFVTDREYVPSGLRVTVKRVPDSADLTFTIKDDGVSILTKAARLIKNAKTDEAAEDWGIAPATIAKNSLISLDITPSGAKGITVEFDLNATEDEGDPPIP